MEQLPKDPMMLLSVVNTKLRDFYPSLDALCEDMEVDRQEIETILQKIRYQYKEDLNRCVE